MDTKPSVFSPPSWVAEMTSRDWYNLSARSRSFFFINRVSFFCPVTDLYSLEQIQPEYMKYQLIFYPFMLAQISTYQTAHRCRGMIAGQAQADIYNWNWLE